MTGRALRFLGLLARALLVLAALASGAYALLAYMPFTYEAVIRFPMVSWVPAFVRWHPALFLAVAAANLGLDGPRLRRPGTGGRRAGHGFLAALALFLLVRAPLAHIRPAGASLVLALAFFLAPLPLLAADIREGLALEPGPGGDADEVRRLVGAALATTLFGALVFPAIAGLRHPAGALVTWETASQMWGWTFLAQLLAALAVATLAMGLVSLGRLLPWPRAGAALLALALGAALTRLLALEALAAVGFHGALAWLAAAAAAALGVAWMGAAAAGFPPGPRLVPDPSQGESALDLLLRPLVWALRGRRLAALAYGLGLAALAWWLLGRAAVFDWNFLFQKGTVLGVQAAVFAGAFAAVPPRRPGIRWVWALIVGPLAALNLFLVFDGGMVERAGALDFQAGRDVSVRFLREALGPARSLAHSIYPALQANSNIPHAVRTDPADIRHVDRLEPAPGPKPDIYVLVVDSLRRDYLGAYNPQVRFTPELDRFAAESLVMRRAFTRYGATGLSEPSIWAGALMLHKQYITPFYPMDSLAKLLAADGYQGLVSMDSILDVVVPRGPWLADLDPGVGTQDLRLGASLDKVRAFLDRRGRDPRPLFVYTQAQDLHISVVNREGRTTVAEGDYGGFYAPYASRVRRLDEAFGRFVAYLKQSGRFDQSIIIVTADHGDSLGEEGRFGHAYTLYPEIVRVPMLVHLPPALRRELTADPDRPAFLTDLTPSLYYLLGHRPVRNDPMLGQPLFTLSAAEREPFRRDHYLLASSYGAVFGILDGAGRELYIADGVEFADHLYRLDGDGPGEKRPLTPAAKGAYDRLILDDLAMVNRFYRFRPAP